MVTLVTVSNQIEATLMIHQLSRENIIAFTTNENSAALLPHYFGMLGHGIQVLVTEADFEKAKAILNASEKRSEFVQCPLCGSRRIAYGISRSSKAGTRWLIFFSAILAVPMGNIKNRHYCRDCNHDLA